MIGMNRRRGYAGPERPIGRKTWALVILGCITWPVFAVVWTLTHPPDPRACLKWADRRHSWGSHYKVCVWHEGDPQ